ncbi:xyloglucan:xyloglucosyl transferase [Ranunculus cassubicifolius]
MEGRMLPAMGSLGLEMSLHHQQQQQQQQFPHTNQHLGSYPIQESQQSLKQSSFSYPNKAKQQQFSDEDEADEGGGIEFYMSSDGPTHNEFDFEFLGNTTGLSVDEVVERTVI